MSTLKTHNLQSPDAASVNIALAPNAGMVVTGISTFTGAIDANGDLDVDGHTNLDNVSIVGVTTTSARLDVGNNGTNAVDLRFRTNRGSAGQTIANLNYEWNGTTVAQIRGIAGSDTTNKDDGHLAFFTTPAGSGSFNERLRITSTGILVTGGGTAPSSTDVGSIFMPGGGDLGWLTSSGSITFNAYYAGGWKYVTSGTSHILWASSEGFNFSTASSGSADGTISYSRAMKIFTNNRVSIGDGNSGTPLAALHINTKSTMGTDTALWIGDNANNRYMAIQQNASSEQFSHMDLVYNDNASRSMINLKNPYAPAGYGAAITWKGYNNGDQGYIECKSEGANSANATMYLNSTNGTFLQGNSNRHVTMPQQPSFAAYQSQSVWTVNGTMVFNSTRHNVGNHYSTSNGHFTAPVAGSYQFNFYSIYRGNHTSAWVSLYKNNSRMMGGDTHFTSPSLGQDWHNVSFSQVLYLNANDYVEMKSAQSTDWHGNQWQCFSGYLLG